MAPSSNKTFKALADPTRREILSLLRLGEMTAGDLAERFDMTKPTMSHHFSVLKEADLLSSRREGQTIWYSLNTTVVQDLMAWAMDLIRGNAAASQGNSQPPQEKREDTKKKQPEGNKL
jgi:DNA-binding transcriptional ArsR family regulator